MKFELIKGNTYRIEATAGTLVFYRCSEHEGILIDTGYAQQDRQPLVELFETTGLRPIGIIVSHTHYDHAGNAEYLKQRYGCRIMASLAEAGTAVSVMSYRCAYPAMTPCEIEAMMGGECYSVDRIVMPEEYVVEFCGVPFGILPLTGHTPGHMGVITPDRVAYLADTLISEEVMQLSKMPTAVCREEDIRAKRGLHALKCDAYVLAHRGVYTSIDALIEKNITYIYEKAQLVYDCLTGNMSEEEWVRAVYRHLEMRSKNAFKCAVCERNMRSMIDWLADAGRVVIERREGVCWYHKR